MTEAERQELEYLRYFHDEVDSALGPASDDVYFMIQEEYVERTGNSVPSKYNMLDEED